MTHSGFESRLPHESEGSHSWLSAPVLKTGGLDGSAGSNPAPSAARTPLLLMVKRTVPKTVNACSSRAGGAK